MFSYLLRRFGALAAIAMMIALLGGMPSGFVNAQGMVIKDPCSVATSVQTVQITIKVNAYSEPRLDSPFVEVFGTIRINPGCDVEQIMGGSVTFYQITALDQSVGTTVVRDFGGYYVTVRDLETAGVVVGTDDPVKFNSDCIVNTSNDNHPVNKNGTEVEMDLQLGMFEAVHLTAAETQILSVKLNVVSNGTMGFVTGYNDQTKQPEGRIIRFNGSGNYTLSAGTTFGYNHMYDLWLYLPFPSGCNPDTEAYLRGYLSAHRMGANDLKKVDDDIQILTPDKP